MKKPKKNKVIYVRVDEKEKQEIAKKAKKSGLSEAAFLRRAGLSTPTH